MNDTAFVFLKIILSACAALLTVVVIPYIRTLRGNAQFNGLVEMITLMVQAAEQTIRQSGKGKDKKEKVTAFIIQYLDEHGIKISQEQLSELIEAAVYSMNKTKQEITYTEEHDDGK